MAKAQVAASDPVARAGAELIIEDGGSATDAVVAGVLSVAAVRSGVLLAPMVALVGGVGAGSRVFDGRTIQPGRGGRRPRGFKDGEAIPDAARAAVPRSFAMLSLLHAHARQRPMSGLIKCVRAVAKQAEAPDEASAQRIDVIEQLPRHGATTLLSIARPMLHAAGPTNGGLLTDEDLRTATPTDGSATFTGGGAEQIAFATLADGAGETSGRHVEVIASADGRGMVCALCYAPSSAGVRVPELGLQLSAGAVPVMRGVPRITPGTTLASPTPLALLRRAADGWFGAIGVAGALSLDATHMPPSTAPLAERLAACRDAAQGTRAVFAGVERGRTHALTTS